MLMHSLTVEPQDQEYATKYRWCIHNCYKIAINV